MLVGLPFTAASAQDGAPFDAAAKERFAASVAPEARPYLVDVGSRWILPGLDRAVTFERGWTEVYLQFARALSAKERGAYVQAGVRFHGALTATTYRAKIEQAHLALLRQDPMVRGVEPVLPTDKLTARLHTWTPRPEALRPDGSLEVDVAFYEDVPAEQALALVERWGVELQDRGGYPILNTLRVVATQGQVQALAEMPAVRSIHELPGAPKADNVTAAAISHVDALQVAPYDLDADGRRLGQWEGHNPLAGHSDLVGRVTVVEDQGAGDHATHVAGTMIGDGTGDPTARGMATGAEVFSYDWNGNVAVEMANASLLNQVYIDNHSWGRILGWDDGVDTGNHSDFGNYDTEAAWFDSIIREYAISVQKSAGNDRNDCDPTDATVCDGTLRNDGERYDTIGTFGNAKNLITVGAVRDDLSLTGFSSSGPSDDGRVKPDLVANGATLWSTWAGGVTLSDCGVGAAYCGISGTSMSTPVVTGAVALLFEQYEREYGGLPGPDILKALLVNTALDLGRPGPDYLFGHGLMDALAAAQAIEQGRTRIMTDWSDTGVTHQYLVEVTPNTMELRLTLAWTDAPGAPDTSNPDLINNLDLEIEAPDGTIHHPFTGPPTTDPTLNATATGPNGRDNVEHLRIDHPSTGIYVARVRGASVPEGPQHYALVTNRAFYLEDEPNIEVAADLSFPGTCLFDVSERPVTIFNTGGADLYVHSITAGADPTFHLLPYPSPPFVLHPGAQITVIVRFAPTIEAIFLGTLTIESNDADEGYLEILMVGPAVASSLSSHLEAKGHFGHVPVGGVETRALQVLNNGLCGFEVTSLGLTLGSAEYSVGEIDGFPGFPFYLFPGESADIYINYEPTDYGPDIAMFTLQTSAHDHPSVPIAVRGDAPPPQLTLSGSFDFSEVCASDLVERTVDVCNTGLSDLEVLSATLSGDCVDFEIVNNPFPATVSHDFCLPLTVRFTPTGAGTHDCTLELVTNDPDAPVVTLPVTGTVRSVSLHVAPDLAFPPTVVQDIAPCVSYAPFPITNNGDCPVTVTGIGVVGVGGYFEVQNLPSFPVTLLPGEQLGDGLLTVSFAPENVERYATANLDVSYLTNMPTAGDKATVTRLLCGEGTRTGMRVVVTRNDVPMAEVDNIRLYRVFFPGTVDETKQIIQLDFDVPLSMTQDEPPCSSVPYHIEYGGETNPITLEPGTYDLWVRHDFPDTSWASKTLRVIIPENCSFLPDVEFEF